MLWFSWADAYLGEDVIVIDENIFSFSSVSSHFHRRCSRHIPAQATWNRYSKEQMKLYIEIVYLNAFVEYQRLVETFIKSISNQLSTYLILPCKIVGALCYDDNNTDNYDSEPSFQYYLMPQPYGEKICIETTLCDERDYLGKK